MKTKQMVFFMLAGLMFCLAGCRRELVPDEAAISASDKKDREIQELLKLVSDWKAHFDLFHVRRYHFASKLNNKIASETDNDRYKKYIGQYIDAAFGIPTDAEESDARLQQLDSFCTMTTFVAYCAEEHGDWNMYWTIALRRLECVQDELQKVKSRFPDNELPEYAVPILGRGGWDNCFRLATQEYEMAVNGLSKVINNILMTHVLSYDEWFEIRSRLEKIIGHEVKIKDSIVKLWERKRTKESSSGKSAANASRK